MLSIKDYCLRKMSRKRARKVHAKANARLSIIGSKTSGRGLPVRKLPSVTVLRKKLEAIIHHGVKIRDKRLYCGLCVTCRAEPIYSANHIIPASESLNTRYDPDNIYGGGIRCNANELYHRSSWALGTFMRVFGSEKMMELHRRASIKVKWGRAEYQDKIEEATKWLEGIINA